MITRIASALRSSSSHDFFPRSAASSADGNVAQRSIAVRSAAQGPLAVCGGTSNDLAYIIEDRIWQRCLGLPVPFLSYNRPAPVASLFREAIEHLALLERVLMNGVSYSTARGRLFEERRHNRLPVVGAILVDVGR